MRICTIIDAWEPIWGGGQTHVWEMSRLLVKRFSHDIDIYTRKLISNSGKKYITNESYLNTKLKVIRVGPLTRFYNSFGRLSWLIFVMIIVVKNHRQKPYDLIHAHAYLGGIPGKLLSVLLDIPVIFTVHGSNSLDLNIKTPKYYLEKYILTQILYNQEISVSYSFLKYPNINANIQVIPNGIDLNNFNMIKNQIDSRYFTYLWVGRYDKVKGIEILIKAFSKLIYNYFDVRLILVGNGSEKENIKNLTHAHKLDKYCKFISKVNHREVWKLYKRADIFILPSLTEGQPITLLEAMASKKAVIATNVGDNCLLVKNGRNGFLVPANNVLQLYQTMKNSYRNSRLKKMGENAYKIVKSKFLWDQQVVRLNKIYQKYE